MDWLQTLQNAGLPTTAAWVDEYGHVQATFSRSLTPNEWQTFLQLTDLAAARHNASKSEAALSGALKTMTPQQAVDWVEANVTTLATAKTVMKQMVRMMIAMRDKIWPDMPEV